MAGPISPSEVDSVKSQYIPEEVFEAFNELIAKNYYQGSSSVNQDDVLNVAALKLSKRSEYFSLSLEQMRSVIFNERWLDVEQAYRQKGWSVEYDKSDWTSTNPSIFKFRKKK